MTLFLHHFPILYLFLLFSDKGGDYKAPEDQSETCHFQMAHQRRWFVTVQPAATPGMEDAVGRQGTMWPGGEQPL